MRVCIYIYIYIYTCGHVCSNTCRSSRQAVEDYTHTHTHTTHTHTHTHTHTQQAFGDKSLKAYVIADPDIVSLQVLLLLVLVLLPATRLISDASLSHKPSDTSWSVC
jgi:hypothetical protein